MSDVRYHQRFAEVKRYTRFTDEDAAALTELLPHAIPEMPRIARLFYERAREHKEAHAVFRDEEQILRLQRSLVAWMERVLTGPYDEAYCDKSVQIGKVHVAVGLPQRFVMSAMTLFRLSLSEIALQQLPSTGPRVVRALTRILDIELALMTESYADAYEQQLARVQEFRQLPERWRHYVAALDLSPTVVVVLDAAGQIELLNRNATKILGYELAEVAGRSFDELFLADATICGFADAMGALENASTPDVKSVELSCLVRTRAGRVRQLRGQMSRAVEENGEAFYFLVGRDVTDEQALEARLRRSEKLAAVGTLAAGLAHEIRNPLNGAQLHLTYLKRALGKRDEGDLTEAVDVVSAEIRRLGGLVTDFLDFARPRELRREELTVQDLCRRCIGLVDRPGGSASDVRIELDLPETEIVAELDAAMIQQVLLNLLNNAVQAVGDSGGTVTLRAFRRPIDVVIEVIDDGPGLPDPEAPIFDAFYSTKDRGTGLGLSIVHRIVSDHGGDVSVDSRPGATRFRIVLPLFDPEEAPSLVSDEDSR
ncbi:MAG: protoglobin domain-containing protein [Polyangiaceae bacterium]